MTLDDITRDEITQALFAGRKIDAIKIYRDATGEGLLESKEFIEALIVGLREEYPDRIPAHTSGCGTAALLFVGTAIGAVVYRCLG
jgi:hypothetical protein